MLLLLLAGEEAGLGGEDLTAPLDDTTAALTTGATTTAGGGEVYVLALERIEEGTPDGYL